MTNPYPYALLEKQLLSLAQMTDDATANMANLSAALFGAITQINWIGFYRVHNGELLLGPFQGKPACVRLQKGKGVCAAAWEKKETVLVPDVHAFAGHVACDAASQSELVVPVVKDGQVWGVLDADSPVLNRFGEDEIKLLETTVKILVENSKL